MQSEAELLSVRKRDNRLVEFNSSKIVDAIFAAFEAVGRPDRASAAELAEAVCFYLTQNMSGQHPHIEEIQDVVEKVLVETNHPDVAKAYILYREERSRTRAQLKICDSLSGAEKSWDKARLLHDFIVEIGLSEEDAATLTAEIEKVLFSMGINSISKDLLRELVANQLRAKGYRAQARLIRFAQPEVEELLQRPDAAAAAYKLLRDAARMGRSSASLAQSLYSAVLMPSSSVGDADYRIDESGVIAAVQLDLLPLAQQSAPGHYDDFLAALCCCAEDLIEYFELQIADTARFLSAVDEKRHELLIKKCCHAISPLDSSSPVVMQVELCNSEAALSYIFGMKDPAGLGREILTTLETAVAALPSYQRITFSE